MIDIKNGNCLHVMKLLDENSVDAIVTDPPYGINFRGAEWDHGVPGIVFWKEMLRLIKPGGFLVSFGGTRTFHRLFCSIEDSGWLIKDCIMWLHGMGFPKGSQLKPSWEPIILAQSPPEKSIKFNVSKYGTGKLNINKSRVPPSDRWPANIVLDEDSSKILDEEVGEVGNRWGRNYGEEDYRGRQYDGGVFGGGGYLGKSTYCDAGGPSRYFYCAKASKRERDLGLSEGENNHPTVKPIELMGWLCNLITPSGGLILDPFMGSGSTGCAAVRNNFSFIGIDKEDKYVEIANKRIIFFDSTKHYSMEKLLEMDKKQRSKLKLKNISNNFFE